MRQRTIPLNATVSSVLAAVLLAVSTAPTASAGPAATQLPVATMTSPVAPAAPVDNAAFAPGADSGAGAPLAGTLRISQTAMQALPELKGPLIGGRDARLFPALSPAQRASNLLRLRRAFVKRGHDPRHLVTMLEAYGGGHASTALQRMVAMGRERWVRRKTR